MIASKDVSPSWLLFISIWTLAPTTLPNDISLGKLTSFSWLSITCLLYASGCICQLAFLEKNSAAFFTNFTANFFPFRISFHFQQNSPNLLSNLLNWILALIYIICVFSTLPKKKKKKHIENSSSSKKWVRRAGGQHNIYIGQHLFWEKQP